MSNRSGSPYALPRDSDRVPAVGGVKSSDGVTVQPLEVDGSGNLLVNVAAGGTAGTQYTDGAAAPTHPIGTIPVYNNAGTITAVSVANPLPVTGGGGGTQYTDGGTPPTHPIGNTLEWNNAGAWATVGSANPLPISGTVTANAGTNLNTSALALESGGNLATIVTDLGTIDTDLKSNITLHAGSNIIGKVGIDQTTPGTTNNVSISGQSGSNTSNLIKDATQYGDGVTTGILADAPMLWNGTNYDRWYGNKTTGAIVNVTNSSIPVTGTFYQTTQPVSLATNTPTLQSGSTTAVTQGTAANLNATVVQGTGTNLHTVTDSGSVTNATLQTQTDTTMIGGVNIKEINAVTPLMGNGTTGTGSLRVTVASDNTAFSIKNQDGAGNALTSNSTTYTSKYGLDSNLLGTLGTAFTTAGFVDVQLTPKTSGGLSTPYSGSIGNTATSVKSSAGQVYSIYAYNNNSSVSYLQVWNTASGSVTVGTTAPIASFGIPPYSGFSKDMPSGWTFSTAITVAITTTRAGSTSPTNTCDLNIWYA